MPERFTSGLYGPEPSTRFKMWAGLSVFAAVALSAVVSATEMAQTTTKVITRYDEVKVTLDSTSL